MRSSWKTLVAVAAALVVGPQLAVADDVQEQLNQMRERMAQLEDSLEATQEELDAAQTRVEAQEAVLAGNAEDNRALSALSSFLNETEFGGVVAASYNWNFMDPPKGAGNNVSTLASHPTHNTFQFDQAHFSMENEATEKSRGGFGFDVMWGAIADANPGAGAVPVPSARAVNGDAPKVIQAYASYLAPFMGGMEVKGGRFDTPIGAEVIYTQDNWNITRGLLWSMQPVSHTGIAVSGERGNWSWQAAGVNGSTDANLDGNSAKSGLFTVGWENDNMGLGTTYMFADDPGGAATFSEGNSQHFIDVVGTWDPSDNLAVWANFDYIRNNVTAGTLGIDREIFGLALASRLAVSDATGVAVRGEWLQTKPTGAPDGDAYSLTGTVDHALTDNLTAKVELRYDNGVKTAAGLPPFDGFTEDNQVIALGQILYEF